MKVSQHCIVQAKERHQWAREELGLARDWIALGRQEEAREHLRSAAYWLDRAITWRRNAAVQAQLETQVHAVGGIVADLAAGLPGAADLRVVRQRDRVVDAVVGFDGAELDGRGLLALVELVVDRVQRVDGGRALVVDQIKFQSVVLVFETVPGVGGAWDLHRADHHDSVHRCDWSERKFNQDRQPRFFHW